MIQVFPKNTHHDKHSSAICKPIIRQALFFSTYSGIIVYRDPMRPTDTAYLKGGNGLYPDNSYIVLCN